MTAPVGVSEHAVDRWIERWAPRGYAWATRELTRYEMLYIAKQARLIETEDNGQTVWAFDPPQRNKPEILFVVDELGEIRTVLPPGTKRGPRRERPLSLTQRRMLEDLAGGDGYAGVHGQSEHGGADGTWRSLVRRGLAEVDEGGGNLRITPAGRHAIAEYNRETAAKTRAMGKR